MKSPSFNFAFLLLSLGLPLAGCSSTPDAQSSCDDLAKAECQKLAQCNSVEMQQDFANDINRCVAAYAPTCTSALTITGTGLTPAFVEGCANATNAQSCDEHAEKSPSACADPPGTLADGVACYDSTQCKGGRCFFPTPASGQPAATCGTCTEATTATPTGCTSSSECPGDQICTNQGFTSGPIAPPQCVTPGGVGAPCAGTTLAPCQPSLQCAAPVDGGTQGTCTALPGLGQACNYGYESCGNSLVCNGSKCVAPTYVPLGGSCTTYISSSATSIGLCAGGQCIQGTCVAFAALGSPCTATATNTGGVSCLPGSICTGGKCAISAPAPVCN